MERTELERQLAELSTLGEPVRRSLYFFVAYRRQDVSRDEAARAVGVSRALAGFHLDRLADEGLLEVSFRRLSGRAGPGAGRPAKLYRRSARQLEVSLPQRSYELAARILVAALGAGEARRGRRALDRTARVMGHRIGVDARAHAGPRPGKKRLVAETLAALSACGYEPEQVGGEVRLRNCPFHSLAQEHRDLVCGMNLALVKGLVEGLQCPGVQPALDPKPGLCCVALSGAK
jgi:predicted ArsR family transcriptional regulator